VQRLTRNIGTAAGGSRRRVPELGTDNIQIQEHQKGSLTVRNHKYSGLDAATGSISHAGAGHSGNENQEPNYELTSG